MPDYHARHAVRLELEAAMQNVGAEAVYTSLERAKSEAKLPSVSVWVGDEISEPLDKDSRDDRQASVTISIIGNDWESMEILAARVERVMASELSFSAEYQSSALSDSEEGRLGFMRIEMTYVAQYVLDPEDATQLVST